MPGVVVGQAFGLHMFASYAFSRIFIGATP